MYICIVYWSKVCIDCVVIGQAWMLLAANRSFANRKASVVTRIRYEWSHLNASTMILALKRLAVNECRISNSSSINSSFMIRTWKKIQWEKSKFCLQTDKKIRNGLIQPADRSHLVWLFLDQFSIGQDLPLSDYQLSFWGNCRFWIPSEPYGILAKFPRCVCGWRS